jgi:hypothetical protein
MKTPLLEFESDLYERFVNAVQVDRNDCWNWLKTKDRRGYGIFKVGRKTFKMSSHRYSFTIHKGVVPEGLVLDHLCRNTSCCNPDHLEAVTQRVNMARGEVVSRRRQVPRERMRPIILEAQKIAAELARTKTHCTNGHEFTPENTNIVRYKPGRTTRVCRECRRLRRKREYAAEASRKVKDYGEA